MNNLLLIFFVVLISFQKTQAQELALCSTSFAQKSKIDLNTVQLNSSYNYNGDKAIRNCKIGMIVGGAFTVMGGIFLYQGSRATSVNEAEIGLFGVLDLVIGVPTLLVNFIGYAVISHRDGYYAKISVYSDPNHLGLAYNF